MVTLAQVQAGVEKYLETEILSKIPDWRKKLDEIRAKNGMKFVSIVNAAIEAYQG